MSPFLKGFLITFIIQIAILSIVSLAFVVGGPDANPVRALIAFLGMGILMLFNLIGIKSLLGIFTSIFIIICLISGCVGWINNYLFYFKYK